MGKVGTLEQGRWPGVFDCLGYDAIREEGKRGRGIVLNGNGEVQAVKDIFNWYDRGKPTSQIRDLLRANGIKQKLTGRKNRKRIHDWSCTIIRQILRNEAYTGKLTWTFADGEAYTITIPQIISVEQFERVQRRLDNGKTNSPRNTKAVYLLQKLLYCGECERKMLIHRVDIIIEN